MNVVREINKINERELELGVKGSWHDEYKDSAYVFVGGLAYDLTEGDIVTIMSQYGEVMDINMPRDAETGKPKGFCFLMYEDQRSTVLAVDNMTGAQVLGRTIRVDHCKKYEQKGSKNENGDYVAPEEPTYNVMPPTLDDESSSDSDPDDLDDEDPMAAYLRQEKKAKRITDGKKRKHEGGESKEEKRRRKEEKKRRKDERDKKRRERDAKKASGSKGRSRSPKRERIEDRKGKGVAGRDERAAASGSRDVRAERERSRHYDDERDVRHRSRPDDDDEREVRHRSRPRDDDVRADRQRSRPHDDRSERHRSSQRDEERQSYRSRLDRGEDEHPRSRGDRSPPARARLPDARDRDDRNHSIHREREAKDDRDRRSARDSRDEPPNGARNEHGDREPHARAEDTFAREEVAQRGPMMNPARARLLAGGGGGRGRGGYSNGGPRRDDRFGRR